MNDFEDKERNRREIESIATAHLATAGIVEPKRGDFSDGLAHYNASTKYWEQHSNWVVRIMNGKAKSSTDD